MVPFAANPAFLHPLLVHFPIALWVVAVVLYALSAINRLAWLRSSALLLGVLGSIGGYFALWSGHRASQSLTGICEPGLLSRHASQSETALWFFGVAWCVAAAAHVIRGLYLPGRSLPRWFHTTVVVALVLGSGYLYFAGTNGFRLVYEQGLAVRNAAPTCSLAR